jgi:hypothetical protein
MEVFFDESGNFVPAYIGAEKFSFVMGVVVPEGATASLKSDFDWLESKLTRDERKQGEPKGALLSLEHRHILLEILKSHSDVMLVPVTVNLGHTDPAFLQTAPDRIRKVIERNLVHYSPHMTTEQRQELARRFSNLSAPALGRLFAYAIGILRAIEAITLCYHCEKFHGSYDPIKLAFDGVVRRHSREELVFQDALFGWIANWTLDLPLKMDRSIDFAHPLSVLYGQEKDGRLVLDLRKMLHGKIGFASSKDVWQIRLADFAVSTWARSILDHGGTKGHQALFRDLHKKTTLHGSQALGVVGFSDETNVSQAPSYLNVFQRMVVGNPKIGPCN